jgi:hypothetical protein
MSYGRLVMAVLGLMAAAAPAAAQDARFSKFYVGGSLGIGLHHDFCNNASISAAAAGNSGVTSCEDTNNAVRAFAGYRFNRNLALEVGYASPGQATAQAIGPGIGPLLPIRNKIKGVDYSGILSFQLSGDLYGYGRAGLYTMRSWTDTYVANAPTIKTAETTTGFTGGIGVGWDLGFLGVRAEWQRYLNIGGGTTPEETIDVLSVGALFRF